MTSKIDGVFRKVLNDREIFDSPYDRNKRNNIPKLFEKDSWKELERLFNEGKRDEFISKVDSRITEIKNQEQTTNNWRREKINELKQRGEWLKLAFDNKPHLLKQLFESLEWYGLVNCNLPDMNSYGRVIERYNISTIEQYFLDGIRRTSYPQNKALEKVLEYVKELYTAGISSEEIAYFVRKLESLTTYWEVIG
ncbi:MULTISPECIES: hypothetical protein [Pseudothermotoga]|jgi:hypothetical protein|uniref:Uncharacterized protein n=1 Tax=Pseudothermotoga lettingae (strain ATCC BAA-301 / DSM 14385 / NBRC 107922 / TMO) TaxID=416591 RepID=A8F3D6_PSELT|nr:MULTISPECIES: hypothetical protein [Pseudothermotoga]ABV32670.1 hypothetical protein Tlet_0099 [Pseudothermotoga lettingae TMO]MDK2885068.1 hypothetical protein [Pseudothermotoga sp.]MDN5338559.1 hypothetical protein [Thermotogaceae bacterium]GLI48337.1 hypothetical protein PLETTINGATMO_05060 [Pseudothermotoga lettingae TMO]